MKLIKHLIIIFLIFNLISLGIAKMNDGSGIVDVVQNKYGHHFMVSAEGITIDFARLLDIFDISKYPEGNPVLAVQYVVSDFVEDIFDSFYRALEMQL